MSDTTKRTRKPLTPEQRQAQYKRSAEWEKDNTTRFVLKLTNNTDTDIIDYLNSLSNKQGYIKSLIRADMARQEKKEEE